MKLNSREEAKERLREMGIPISQWARARQFDPDIVYAVLSGRASGHWGMAHKVALALGLKRRPGEIKLPRPIDENVGQENSSSAGGSPPSDNRR